MRPGARNNVLVLVDGGFERVVEFWRQLPERTVLLGRTARSRVLYELPGEYQGRGRPKSYGERARKPSEWLKERRAGRSSRQSAGTAARDALPGRRAFLARRVGGSARLSDRGAGDGSPSPGATGQTRSGLLPGLGRPARAHWVLPLPEEELLAWAWQRWEVEVAHREMKSGFGLGEKQCWNKRSAVRSVQWSAWVYAVLLWRDIAPGACAMARPPPPAGGRAPVAGPSIPFGALTAPPYGARTIFRRFAP